MNAENDRIQSEMTAYRRWGPYLAERAWGTVREDYSANGDAWNYLPHDHARSRVYRWNEDGLLGICDDQQRLCFAPTFWNGRDPILKERLFGLSGPEGNHGEDVKEYYYYLDSTPTHSYMKALYKYPHAEFPYRDLVETNRRRNRQQTEYELIDTGVFAENRYFDIFIEYAKAGPRDILIRIQAVNRGPEPAALDILPTLWFRNTWAWEPNNEAARPTIHFGNDDNALVAEHFSLGRYVFACEGADTFLFTENETNCERLFGTPNQWKYVKDGIDEAIVHGHDQAVNSGGIGTKAAAHFHFVIEPGQSATTRLRLFNPRFHPNPAPFDSFDAIVEARKTEADEFYLALEPRPLSDDEKLIQRQAFAGLLWSKQYYHYEVSRWLSGDPDLPPPPPEREDGRNEGWRHLNNADVISMPDKWEYPWYASWDLAFHCLPLALVDPEFAKAQLVLLGREWYQHPNGQIPAYEWGFSDANPPVLAWATWRVYKIEQKQMGTPHGDLHFLERMYHKLMLNFTWWVNRKDSEGNNIFQGGFLGLDNIGVFDRSAPLPTGGHLEQSDSTSWMGMFCLNMLTIALELARYDAVYEDIASKFFEHFLYIAEAMNNIAGEGIELWDPEDRFFYDVLHLGHGQNMPLRIRSMVGIIPLFAVATIEPALLNMLPQFKGRLEWFLNYRRDLAQLVSRWHEAGMGERRLMAICRGHRMKCVLRRVLDPDEFLSPYGVRALSRYHLAHPFQMQSNGMSYSVDYEPAESTSGLFGGNSNWRGPIWFPVNYLLIEALQQYHHYYGDDFKVECPTGSGVLLSLNEIADELSRRLMRLFERGTDGRRPVLGGTEVFQSDPNWRDYILFYEYFNGDTGAGLGASHQTGWTGLIAKLIQQQGTRMEMAAHH